MASLTTKQKQLFNRYVSDAKEFERQGDAKQALESYKKGSAIFVSDQILKKIKKLSEQLEMERETTTIAARPSAPSLTSPTIATKAATSTTSTSTASLNVRTAPLQTQSPLEQQALLTTAPAVVVPQLEELPSGYYREAFTNSYLLKETESKANKVRLVT